MVGLIWGVYKMAPEQYKKWLNVPKRIETSEDEKFGIFPQQH